MVVPAEPGAAFEVVEAQGDFEFAVVVLDAPAEFREADEFVDRRTTWTIGGTGTRGPRAHSPRQWVTLATYRACRTVSTRCHR